MKNLPKGWKMQELGDFIESLESGVSVNSTDEERHAGTKRVLKISAVVNGVFLPHQNKIVTKQDEHRTKLNPKAGSIIISRANTAELVGQCGYVDKDYPDLYLPDKLWQTVLHKEVKISTRWLTYFLSSDLIKPLLLGAATGTSGSMKNISKSSFLEIPVPTPPLPEQQRIAAILDACDRAIKGTAKLLEKHEKRRNSVRVKLQEHATKAADKTIGSFAKEVSVKNKAGAALTVLSCTKHAGLVRSLEYFDRQVFSKNLSTYKVVRRGEFAYATNHLEEGSIGYQNLEDMAVISPMYTVLKTDDKQVDAGYLFRLLKSPEMVQRYKSMTSASVDRRGSLRWKDFATIKVRLPSLAEQQSAEKIMLLFDQEIRLLRQQLTLLQQQKKGLMQRLLTGQSF